MCSLTLPLPTPSKLFPNVQPGPTKRVTMSSISQTLSSCCLLEFTKSFMDVLKTRKLSQFGPPAHQYTLNALPHVILRLIQSEWDACFLTQDHAYGGSGPLRPSQQRVFQLFPRRTERMQQHAAFLCSRSLPQPIIH